MAEDMSNGWRREYAYQGVRQPEAYPRRCPECRHPLHRDVECWYCPSCGHENSHGREA